MNIIVEDADTVLRARYAEPDRDRRPRSPRERHGELHAWKHFQFQKGPIFFKLRNGGRIPGAIIQACQT